jgi:hypothetical protein
VNNLLLVPATLLCLASTACTISAVPDRAPIVVREHQRDPVIMQAPPPVTFYEDLDIQVRPPGVFIGQPWWERERERRNDWRYDHGRRYDYHYYRHYDHDGQ